jgi:iron complex transport system substrate-binding protein
VPCGPTPYHCLVIRTTSILALACVLFAALLIVTQAANAGGVGDAVNYIKGRQSTDGGFAEPDASSDGLTTCWAMLAGTAAGQKVLDWKNAGLGPQNYLESQAGSLSKLPDIEIYALALAESGADPRNLGGKNLVALIKAEVKSDGQIGQNTSEHCWGLIALVASRESIPAKSASWLAEHQRADGGWGESDAVVVADTGLAVEALVGMGQAESTAVDPALKLLRQKMGADGGFAGPKGGSNVQLTGAVMRAVYAGGQDPGSSAWTFHGNSPVSFLEAMQASDGHYQYSKGVESQPSMTTSVAVPAVGGKHFPLSAAAASASQAGGIRDLGATGAGMTPGAPSETADQSGTQQAAVTATASGDATASGGLGGVWIFLMMCIVYVIALVAAALIVARLYVPGKGKDPPVEAADPWTPPGMQPPANP